MKTIIANLKLYYPNRYFWPSYLYLSILVYFIIILVSGKRRVDEQLIIGIFMYIPFFAGYSAALMQIDVFMKPFSFCLPGHKQNAMKILFLIGIATSFLIVIIMTLFLLNTRHVIIIPIFFTSLTFFLLGVEVSFFARGMLSIIFIAALLSSLYTYPYQALGELITNHSVLVIFIGLLCCYLIWRHLNQSELSRRFCAIPLLINPFDLYNKEKLENFTRFKEASKKGKQRVQVKPSVERFFLDRMNKYEYFSIGRYIWGNLYKTYGPQISSFHPMGFLIFLAVVFPYCYLHEAAAFALFGLILMMTIFIQIPVYSTMLVSNGRKERYYSFLGMSIIYSFYILLIGTLITFLTHIAGFLMPDLELLGHTLTFTPISYSFSVLIVITVPFVFIFRLIFHKRRFLMFMTIVFLYAILMASLIILNTFMEVDIREVPSIILNPFSMMFLIILLWTIFFEVMRHVCFKRSLI